VLARPGSAFAVVTLDALAEEMKESIRVLSDQSSELGVSLSDLLENRLEHLRRLLDKPAELLELLVVAKEVQSRNTGTSSGSGSGSGTTTRTTTRSSGRRLKKVDVLGVGSLLFATSGSLWRGRLSGSRLVLGRTGRGSAGLLREEVFWDTLRNR
jgi:hypothetical protein